MISPRSFSIIAIALILSPAAFGQVDLIGRYSVVDTDAHEELEGDPDQNSLRIEIDEDSGYGIALNFWMGNKFSIELGGSVIEPDVIITESGDVSSALINTTGIEMIPMTAVVQYHFRQEGPLDIYGGAGVGYVLLDDIDGDRLDDIDLDRIEFDEDAGFVINLGLNWIFTDVLALNVDAKYIPLESSANVVFADLQGEARDISINPLIVSAGLSARF